METHTHSVALDETSRAEDFISQKYYRAFTAAFASYEPPLGGSALIRAAVAASA